MSKGDEILKVPTFYIGSYYGDFLVMSLHLKFSEKIITKSGFKKILLKSIKLAGTFMNDFNLLYQAKYL